GRYDFHDLLRVYAAERAREEEDHDAALRRVLDWYLHTAHDAAEHLPDGAPPFSPGLVPRDVRPHDFDDPEAAVGWYEEELPNLLAPTHAAPARGWRHYSWRRPRVLPAFLDFHVPGRAWAELYRVAAEACRAEGELREEGVALNHLAQVYTRMGDLAEAVACHGRALEAARRTGDRELEGEVLIRLGTAEFRRGRPAESTECYTAALTIARESGDRHLEAEARVDIAQNLNEAGR